MPPEVKEPQAEVNNEALALVSVEGGEMKPGTTFAHWLVLHAEALTFTAESEAFPS